VRHFSEVVRALWRSILRSTFTKCWSWISKIENSPIHVNTFLAKIRSTGDSVLCRPVSTLRALKLRQDAKTALKLFDRRLVHLTTIGARVNAFSCTNSCTKGVDSGSFRWMLHRVKPLWNQALQTSVDIYRVRNGAGNSPPIMAAIALPTNRRGLGDQKTPDSSSTTTPTWNARSAEVTCQNCNTVSARPRR